ncbi:hypothetical protein A2U01_0112219, partial [Trifolium medium]|nr:hypothetical protein [Trifolium medium]
MVQKLSFNWNMHQTLDIVQCDPYLTYWKVEGTRFRMPSFSKCRQNLMVKYVIIGP